MFQKGVVEAPDRISKKTLEAKTPKWKTCAGWRWCVNVLIQREVDLLTLKYRRS